MEMYTLCNEKQSQFLQHVFIFNLYIIFTDSYLSVSIDHIQKSASFYHIYYECLGFYIFNMDIYYQREVILLSLYAAYE
jgi:hypothetical protein